MAKRRSKSEVEQSTEQPKKSVRYTLRLILYYGLFMFLMANILLSQYVSPLYFRFIMDDIPATAQYIKKMQNTPQFQALFSEQKKIFGNDLEEQVYMRNITQAQLKNKLEQVLKLNPKSRDALYELYVINEREGNHTVAQAYLDRAIAVDPMVNN
jgi:tetratricopeptide (TPR) repeat protein